MPEIEAKFRPADAAVLEQLAALQAVGSLRVSRVVAQRQSDVYFDTPARDLASAHASLRIREIDGRRLFTVKVGRVSTIAPEREEVEEPGPPGTAPPAWLQQLRDTGRIVLEVDTSALIPVLEVHNLRTTLHTVGSAGEVLELALDRLTFRGPRGEVSEPEVELELKHGPTEALAEAAQWLTARFALVPSTAAKYQRALAAVG